MVNKLVALCCLQAAAAFQIPQHFGAHTIDRGVGAGPGCSSRVLVAAARCRRYASLPTLSAQQAGTIAATSPRQGERDAPKVVVVGAGFAGLGGKAAI